MDKRRKRENWFQESETSGDRAHAGAAQVGDRLNSLTDIYLDGLLDKQSYEGANGAPDGAPETSTNNGRAEPDTEISLRRGLKEILYRGCLPATPAWLTISQCSKWLVSANPVAVGARGLLYFLG